MSFCHSLLKVPTKDIQDKAMQSSTLSYVHPDKAKKSNCQLCQVLCSACGSADEGASSCFAILLWLAALDPGNDLPFGCVGQMVIIDPNDVQTLVNTHNNNAIDCSVIHSAA